jgi:hypothetical protein
MKSRDIKARFTEFPLPPEVEQDATAVIPTVIGKPLLKYGGHAYYFLNFRTLKGLRVSISHKDIILPVLSKFFSANHKTNRWFPGLKAMFQSYHYGFSFAEQIMLMTVPHTATDMGNGRFLINLWSYFGYLDVDCNERSIKYVQLDEKDNDFILGSQQYFDKQTDETYFMSYSLTDSLKRSISADQPVSFKIQKRNNKTAAIDDLWSGDFVDNTHDILVNKTRQYCVVCEMGMFKDDSGNMIPSKVLVLDLANNKSWILSRFIVAAHAQFDPDEPDVIYFSNHNFEFKHSSMLKLLKNAIYDINFQGPASVYKYRLTPDGPVEISCFTDSGFFRLTNLHVFKHRGQRLLAATGSPNFIYIVDADTMKCIKKIEVEHTRSAKHLYKDIPCIIGTISPSIDGESIFVQTTRSVQVVDVASGESKLVLDHFYHHTCANHMLTSSETGWKS